MNPAGSMTTSVILRQAHLFQSFGLNGIDTDIACDDDRYFSEQAEGDRLSRME